MSKSSIREPKVITFAEIAMLIALTTALMVLFFPKNSIEKAIESEKSNYDLTLTYLKSLVQAYPEDPENYRRLMEAELKMGNAAEAAYLFQKSGEHIRMSDQEKAIWHYRILKERYLKSEGAQREEIRKLLLRKLHRMLQSNHPSQWFLVIEEAKVLQMPELRFAALEKYLLHTTLPDDAKITALIRVARQLNKTENLQRVFQHLASISLPDTTVQKIERALLAAEDYASAARFFESCYRHSENGSKNSMLLKSIHYYYWAKIPQKARTLLQEEREQLTADNTTAEALIKILLANGELKAARTFTLQLLRKEKVLR